MIDQSPHPYHLVYFADPMCSWCYGFSPVIEALAANFGLRLPIDIVMGGLRPGETRPMREKDKDYLRETWTRVGEASGQPFDLSAIDRDGFVYDTEPACRAVVAVRTLVPEAALGFKARVSRGFYAEGRDTTRPGVLADLAVEAGLEREAFEAAFALPEIRDVTRADFRSAQQLGVQGFPTLIAGSRETNEYALVTNGFRPLDGLPEALDNWLSAKGF